MQTGPRPVQLIPKDIPLQGSQMSLTEYQRLRNYYDGLISNAKIFNDKTNLLYTKYLDDSYYLFWLWTIDLLDTSHDFSDFSDNFNNIIHSFMLYQLNKYYNDSNNPENITFYKAIIKQYIINNQIEYQSPFYNLLNPSFIISKNKQTIQSLSYFLRTKK
jgi:hypothetical protein